MDRPGAEDLRAAQRKSNDALAVLEPRVQQQQSFVTADKVYCVYIAEDESASPSTPPSADSPPTE